MELDEELKKETDKVLTTARVSLSEYYLIDAITMQEKQKQKAKDQVNGQIAAWPKVHLDLTDIHGKVWEVCLGITSGKLITK